MKKKITLRIRSEENNEILGEMIFSILKGRLAVESVSVRGEDEEDVQAENYKKFAKHMKMLVFETTKSKMISVPEIEELFVRYNINSKKLEGVEIDGKIE